MTLLSSEYQATLQSMHEAHPTWGGKGHRYIPEFMPLYKKLRCETLLDYGCGKGRIKRELAELDKEIAVTNYDPGMPEWSALPEPADFVVSVDVFEHIEPALVDDVLEHVHSLAKRGAYFCIGIKIAKHILPDGRNAHLIIEPAEWWLAKLEKHSWKVVNTNFGQKGFRVWLKQRGHTPA